jgi:hypothetical protein
MMSGDCLPVWSKQNTRRGWQVIALNGDSECHTQFRLALRNVGSALHSQTAVVIDEAILRNRFIKKLTLGVQCPSHLGQGPPATFRTT